MDDGFGKICFILPQYFNVFVFNLSIVFFKDIFNDRVNSIFLFDGVVDLNVTQKAVENGINFFNILGDDSIKKVFELWIVKFVFQELRKGLDGDKGVFDSVDQFHEKG